MGTLGLAGHPGVSNESEGRRVWGAEELCEEEGCYLGRRSRTMALLPWPRVRDIRLGAGRLARAQGRG